MSHIICRHCGSNEHYSGYGLAAGGMSQYTYCSNCDRLIEYVPDLEGYPRETLETMLRQYIQYRFDSDFHGRDMIGADIGI